MYRFGIGECYLPKPLWSLVFAVLLAGCTSSLPSTGTSPQTGSTAPTDTARRWQPTLAPGATDTAVNQANIATTICVPGYTAKVRPPVSYTNAIKVNLFKAEHAPGRISDYELDHMVPLELGGAPRDINNLWLEPNYKAKDAAENRYHDWVCSGALTLAEAQKAILDPTNWH